MSAPLRFDLLRSDLELNANASCTRHSPSCRRYGVQFTVIRSGLVESAIRLATSLLAEATSFLGPAATSIANEVHEVVTPNAYVNSTVPRLTGKHANGTLRCNRATQGSAARPLAMGAAAVLGSMVLGAYAVL